MNAKPSLSPATAELVGQIVELVRREGVQPGERLFEYRLSQKLGISRGPVRVALQAQLTAGADLDDLDRHRLVQAVLREAAPGTGAGDVLGLRLRRRRELTHYEEGSGRALAHPGRC